MITKYQCKKKTRIDCICLIPANNDLGKLPVRLKGPPNEPHPVLKCSREQDFLEPAAATTTTTSKPTTSRGRTTSRGHYETEQEVPRVDRLTYDPEDDLLLEPCANLKGVMDQVQVRRFLRICSTRFLAIISRCFFLFLKEFVNFASILDGHNNLDEVSKLFLLIFV